MLIALGLSLALLAMALDEWTVLHELELITGCIGLVISVIAATIAACDLTSPGARNFTRVERLPVRLPHRRD